MSMDLFLKDINGGYLDESKPKEMFSVIPVVYCKAVPINVDAKEDKGLYICPTRKWIIAGVAL